MNEINENRFLFNNPKLVLHSLGVLLNSPSFVSHSYLENNSNLQFLIKATMRTAQWSDKVFVPLFTKTFLRAFKNLASVRCHL